ncbi:hypothetical protein GDO86_016814 [Hymenochirus boettgeri]|uniref:Poly [ADP-ribose] polymerase n=1 Tax=Hymenochirus boettgeri TaxID=247094 RepID=A0A8T2IMM8_9PIPI|nr:hypothetical protein GDO86_016814 [Hymenochirus boettgeri]
MNELFIGTVQIQLKLGDITKEDVDAIVNLNNYTLNQTFGVSQAILSAAGTQTKEECQRLGQGPHGDIVITGAGNLNCKKIIHIINVSSAKKIVDAVTKALEACDQNNIATVSFPAMGTGSACLSTNTSFNSVFTGFQQYLSGCQTTCISQINLVVLALDSYEKYLKCFQNKIFGIQRSVCQLSIRGITVELIKGDITDQAVDCIVNFTNKTLNQKDGVSGAILSKAGWKVTDECKSIGKLPSNGIALTSGGNLKCTKIMHLIGPNSVKKIVSSLQQILLECRTHSFKTIALPAIGTGMAGIDPQKSAEEILKGFRLYLGNFQLSLENISIVAFTDKVCKSFSDVFHSGALKSESKDRSNCTDLAQIPPTWCNMDGNNYISVELMKDSDEYKSIEKRFLDSADDKTINVIQIERIQNKKLWRSYTVKKEFVQHIYPNLQIERHLYHGTNIDTAKKISIHGFNRSFSGKNATLFGHGTYFARDASYSCQDKYSVKDVNGYKHVYLASVITGRWCLGNSRYVEPPPTTEDPDVLCDSLVDNVNNPSIFVICCDDGAYPEYLITFE